MPHGAYEELSHVHWRGVHMMVWSFVWLLAGAGFQVSPAYPTEAACMAAWEPVHETMRSPEGKRIEVLYDCRQEH